MDIKDLDLEKLKKERPDLVEALQKEQGPQLNADKGQLLEISAETDPEALAKAIADDRKRTAAILAKAQELDQLELGKKAIEEGHTLDKATADMALARLSKVEEEAPSTPGPDDDPEEEEIEDTEETEDKKEDASDDELKKKFRKEFNKDAKLRKEFSSFERYYHFRKAQEKGLVDLNAKK